MKKILAKLPAPVRDNPMVIAAVDLVGAGLFYVDHRVDERGKETLGDVRPFEVKATVERVEDNILAELIGLREINRHLYDAGWGYAMAGPEHVISHWGLNASDIFKRDRIDVVGKLEVEDLMAETSRESHRELFDAAMESEDRGYSHLIQCADAVDGEGNYIEIDLFLTVTANNRAVALFRLHQP